MATNEELLDDAVATRLRLSRFENQLVYEAQQDSQAMEAAIVALILSLPRVTPASIRTLRTEIVETITRHYTPLINRTLDSLNGAADVVARNEVTMVGGRASQRATAAAVARPYEGYTAREWLMYQREALARFTTRQIRIGLLNGRSPASVARQFIGSRGISARTLQGVALTARTVLSGIHNWLREQLWKASPRIDRVMQISVLDSRTTPICQTLHGRIWPVGEGPRPPHHANCRSIVVPLQRGQAAPALETWNQWLQRQADMGNEGIVREALGATRADLFLAGELSLDRFVSRNGLRYSLAELQQRYPAAFQPPRG